MSYFKARSQRPISKPAANRVLFVQLVMTFFFALIATFFAPNIGASVALGGLISLAGQAFYNFRALRHFGSPDITLVISATYSAMWGKWMIIIAVSLIAAIKIEELNTGVLYASIFFVHTVGAILLPVLVKRVAL